MITPSMLAVIFIGILALNWILKIIIQGIAYSDIKNQYFEFQKNEDYGNKFYSLSREEIEKSFLYNQRKMAFGFWTMIFRMIYLIVVIAFKVIFYISLWFTSLDPILSSLLTIFIVFFIFELLELPFEIYRTFKLEAQFGFNKTNGKTFVLDFIKGNLVGLILGGILIVGLYYLIMLLGDLWWIAGFVFFIVFQLLILFIYPLWIAPLFNKFTPLPEGELKTALFELAGLLKFNVTQIFVVDGSKRSGHSNAYFTGFGKNKRIVLYDTLINQLSVDELKAVLAHEIGHYKKKHLLVGFIISIVLFLVGFFLLQTGPFWDSFYETIGFSTVSFASFILFISLFLGDCLFFLKPLTTLLSRKNEFQADNYAKQNLGSGKDLVNALLKLNKENKGLLYVHPVYVSFYYSHPPITQRIKELEK